MLSSSPPLVITAFQRGKWYLQEADRYAELADGARQVVIMAAPDTGFAEHPTSRKSNVDLVELDPADPVAQEWHLMILAPTYSAMVLCQELSPADYGRQGQPEQDLERKFYGFWTFEANLVQETVELAIAHIQRYDPDLADRLTAHAEQVAAHQAEQRDDLGAIVSRVVDYLQAGERELDQNSHSISVELHQDILDSNLVSNEVQAFLRMAQLTDQADALNPNAAAESAALAEAIGQLLDLPVWQLHRLKLAALLHRLAPLQRSESILTPSRSGHHTENSVSDAPSCSLVPGAQVLRKMPRLRAIAAIITHQTEHWDGSGQPAGLLGDEIPLESRILGLVADFQQRLAYLRNTVTADGQPLCTDDCMTRALEECKNPPDSGATAPVHWDPKLVDTLALLVSGMQQGLNLPVYLPKISSGLWLIDSHCSDDLFVITPSSELKSQ